MGAPLLKLPLQPPEINLLESKRLTMIEFARLGEFGAIRTECVAGLGYHSRGLHE
jgi:hypothetical protein